MCMTCFYCFAKTIVFSSLYYIVIMIFSIYLNVKNLSLIFTKSVYDEMSVTIITSTTYPPTSSYETPDTVPELFHLDRYEKIFLISFEFLCTFLTITFNAYLIFIIVAKVKCFINILCISIYGLILSIYKAKFLISIFHDMIYSHVPICH
jgi:hypothetical protein